MTFRETGTGVTWGHSALRLTLDVSPDGPVGLRSLSTVDAPASARTPQPLVEVWTPGAGRRNAQRFAETPVGLRMRYVGGSNTRDGRWHELRVDLHDETTGLAALVEFRSADGISACQVRTTITNQGPEPVLLLGVTSFAACFLGSTTADVDLVRGDSEWLSEGRWTRRPLRDVAPDLNLPLHRQDPRGRYAEVSTGTWSTGTHLPTAGIVDRDTGRAWLWQIEHNGGWHWEVGELRDGVYVSLLGPNDRDHQWIHRLAPGESFTTVPVSVAVSDQDLEGAVAAMTGHRREIVRPRRDRSALPVVFNDYMNTLMGDPTTAKLLPLIDAASAAGAEIFCIDAGWYDDGANWWDSVGEWLPSRTRFPGGIEEVLARVRDRGMTPGLWLEPEVVGVRSPTADRLPATAFLQRAGVRLVEAGRYHLDLRHPAAVAHLDEVVDRLVERLGIGYFKLDYNIDAGVGTDVDADSVGAGLLGHNRAHLAWLDGVLDRHPDLLLENCGSGAMRMDYAVLSRMHLQSTSDQQDFTRYPPIAVATPMSLLPEQSASWAYPQPEMPDEEIAFTLCTAMLGRLYLSGHLDGMRASQLDLVREAVVVHKEIRADLARAVPLWPLGLPQWTDPWLCLAMRSDEVTYLTAWCRLGPDASATLSLPHLRGEDVTVDVLFPRSLPEWGHRWNPDSGTLDVTAEPRSARLFRITPKTGGRLSAPGAADPRPRRGGPATRR